MSVVADPNAAVNDLADRFWEGVLERSPLTATIYGDERYDDRLPDLGPHGRAADEAAYRETLEEARAIPADSLDAEAVITRDMLTIVCANQLEALEKKQYQMALDHMGGPQTLPAEIAQYQRADTPERLDRLLTRYASFGEMIEQHVETLAEGVAEGRTSAAVPVRRAIEQIERMVATPVEEAPSVTLAQVDDAARARLVEATREHIYPALTRLRDYLARDYEPHARQQPGILATPGGEEAYALAIRMSTTVSLSPREVHEFGLDDLASIEAEKDAIARRLGHADRSALAAALAEDADNHTDDPAAIVRLATEQTERAWAAAPRYFGRLPSANCVVKAVESYRERESPPAFYMPPSVDGARQGQYYINTYQPSQRQLHKIASITFHEATPGHHFQIGIEMELEGLPRFRTLGSRMAGVAYVEGWGLYTERLADEMDLYASDPERLGMLDAQSFRAARLVVDSGLHAMGWDRDRAIAFMHERGSLPPVDAAIEVDRYTVWPGQALAYKVGQREIERARADVAAAMGSRFDLRAFHDQVLGHGSLPLATLRREILGWVEAAVGAPR
ncbi:MAG TPA: DUF885 domain-containing protein [Candidatus Limnocylindria bacterium]|nr:DUF885 domain-containing protein [Candidatus Limnocylindria bacterium]